MVALDTRLPLQVEPFRLDLRAPVMDAANLKGKLLANDSAAAQNEMSQMQLTETRDQFNALKGYREAAAAGDTAAMDKLSAYPEMQLNMRKALEGLEDEDLADAEEELEAVARAAEVVKAVPPEKRQEVWNQQLDALLDGKMISQEQYDEHYDNPSDLVLDQAIVAAQTADELRATREAQKKLAVETARDYPTKESDLSLEQKLEIDKQVADRVKAAAGDFGFDSLKEQKKAEQQARQAVLTSLGIEPDLSGGPTKPKKKGAGAAGEETTGAVEGGEPLVDLPPPEAITMLERMAADPATRASAIAHFDEIFGEGAAAKVIGTP